MTAKTHEIAFKIAGKMSGDFTKSFKKANEAVKGFQGNLVDLNKEAAKVDKIVRLRKETGLAAREYMQARNKVAELGKAINASGKPTQKMIADFNKAKLATDKAKTALEKKRAALKEVETAAGTTGVKLKTLIQRQKDLASQTERSRIAQQKYSKTLASFNKAKTGIQENAGYAAASSAGIGAGLVSATKTAMNFEDQQAELRKYSKEYEKIFGGIINLTQKYGKTSEDMTNMAAAAMQAGIAKNSEDVLKIIEAQTQAAVAFGMTGEAVGSAWSDIQGKLGLDVSKTKEVFDVINKLGNDTNASSEDIIDVLQRQGGTLKGLTALTAEQITALAGAFRSAAPSSEVAASSMATFFGRLGVGAEATKKQQNAFNELGFDAIDMSKKLTGSSDTAQKAVQDILKKINELPKHKQGAVIGALFGNEAGIKSAVSTLASQSEILGKNFGIISEKTNYAGSMLEEYKSRADTTSESLKIAQNSLANISAQIGIVLLPYVRKAAEAFTKVSPKVIAWVKENKNLVTTLAIVGAAISGAVAAAVPLFIVWKTLVFYGNGLKLVLSAISLLFKKTTYQIIANKAALVAQKTALIASKAAMLAWKTVVTICTTAVKLFGTALKFLFVNPIGLAILALAGLVAAGVLVYKNWDTIKAKAAELWESIKKFFGKIGDFIGGIWDKIGGIWGKVTGFFGGGNKSVNVKATGAQVPGLAKGGIATAPTLAMIGEGRESEAVLPLSKLSGMLGGGAGGGISVNFAPTINITGAGGDAYAEVKRGLAEGQKNLKRELERIIANQRRLSYT